MRWLAFLLSLVITLGLILVLSRPVGPIPFALGPFVDPYGGFWAASSDGQADRSGSWALPGLEGPVSVVLDARRVPHIFAQSDRDLYFVQGYITARDRLWQMEFQTLAAAGRLSEFMPTVYEDLLLQRDREMRRLGMVLAAQNSLDALMQDPASKTAVLAYTEGINQYIHQLSPRKYPLEYKILGYQPQRWTPLKTCLLLSYMAHSLSGPHHSPDLALTYAYQKWGPAVFDSLYPQRLPNDSPIIPAELPFDFVREQAAPQAPVAYFPDSILAANYPFDARPQPQAGSNNWAVAGTKTRTGAPMLANDPHLDLNLPALWYEVQLHAPGVNVYGVSLPGSPGVIIGFNDSIAWGVTNASRDVMDFYRITYQDARKSAYRYQGQWAPVEVQVDTFRLKGGGVVYDTVRYTDLGPVMYDESFGDYPFPVAVRWMAHQPSNELATFLRLNRAKNYADYLAALEGFQNPGQNFAFASRSGDIALWQQGRFVDRWGSQGRFLLDAADTAHQWEAYIPRLHNPHVVNPPRGFVSSANQHPVAATYPYNYYGNFEYYRNRRLNQLLAADDSLEIEDMQRIQLDTYSMLAAEVLPVLIHDLDSASLTDKENEAFRTLKAWDYYYRPEEIAPAIFEAWWDTLYGKIWTDEFEPSDHPLKWPDVSTTAQLLREGETFSFFDDRETPRKEDRRALVNHSFRAALQQLYDFSPEQKDWAWAQYKNTRIRHVARLSPAFGRDHLPIGGNVHILNATSETKGPSWRMVVTWNREGPEAYGIYPGGPSGNQGSAFYDPAVDDWAQGNYYRLWYMHAPDEEEHLLYRQTFKRK